MCSCTHVLLNRVWMIKAEHPLTDDNCLQLDTAGLKEKESQMRNSFIYIKRNSLGREQCIHVCINQPRE